MSITNIRHTESVTLPLSRREHENAASLADTFGPLLQRLEGILDQFLDLDDEYSLQLFDWGSRTITLVEDSEESRLKEILSDHFDTLRKKCSTEDLTHAFAVELFSWLEEAEKAVQSSLTFFSPEEKFLQQQIQRQRQHRQGIVNLLNAPLPGTQRVVEMMQQEGDIPFFVKDYIRSEKEVIENKIMTNERQINEEMRLQRERFSLERERLEFQISNTEIELSRAQNELSWQNNENAKNSKKIQELQSQLKGLQAQVRQLEQEVSNSDSGCVIS